jgi:hypothetical protein
MTDNKKPLTQMLIAIITKIFFSWKNQKKPTSAISAEGVPHVEKEKENRMFVNVHEILMGREVQNPLTPEMKQNLDKLILAANKLRAMWGKPVVISSGYRPPAQNAAAGGAAKSNHMICAAIDIKDPNQELAKFLISRLDVLESCGLWMEDPSKTVGWVHVQIYPPKSGRRIFLP